MIKCFDAGRQPETIHELLEFGLFAASQILPDLSPDRRPVDGYYIFKEGDSRFAMILPPPHITKADKDLLTDAYAGVLKGLDACATVQVMSGTGAALPKGVGDAIRGLRVQKKDVIAILAQTKAGEIGMLVYDLERRETGRWEMANGVQFTPQDINVSFMAELFSRDVRDPVAIEHAQQALAHPELEPLLPSSRPH